MDDADTEVSINSDWMIPPLSLLLSLSFSRLIPHTMTYVPILYHNKLRVLNKDMIVRKSVHEM